MGACQRCGTIRLFNNSIPDIQDDRRPVEESLEAMIERYEEGQPDEARDNAWDNLIKVMEQVS